MKMKDEIRALVVKALLEYSEDQPRDERGRWTSEGGGGGTATATAERRSLDDFKHKELKHIAKKLEKNYRKSEEDLCKERPELCADNIGISRNDMPQLDGAVVKEFVADLRKQGLKITNETVPVDSLKATQNEMETANALSKAANFLRGKYPGLKNAIVVSKDGHILDGHHRWAALQLAQEASGVKQTMDIIRVNTTIQDLIKRANAFEGVTQRAMGEARRLILSMLAG